MSDDAALDCEELEPLGATRFLLCEFFAGTGVLTSAVMAAGVPTRPPDDLAMGGANFEHGGAVHSHVGAYGGVCYFPLPRFA